MVEPTTRDVGPRLKAFGVALGGHCDVLALLVQSGADINATSNEGTALSWAPNLRAQSEALVLWDPQTREPVLTLPGTDTAFVRTEFSTDGSRLGSRGYLLPNGDGILHVWRAPTWKEIEAEDKRAKLSRSAQ